MKLGAHTESILRSPRCSEKDICALRATKAI